VGKATVSTDQQATAMVQRGSRIAAVTDLRQRWEFKLIADDTQANAFALPGGEVAVYTGIRSRGTRTGHGAGPRDPRRAASEAAGGYADGVPASRRHGQQQPHHRAAGRGSGGAVEVDAGRLQGPAPVRMAVDAPSEAARIEQLERWMPEAMTYYKPAR
jgi:peptidase M48-like protein